MQTALELNLSDNIQKIFQKAGYYFPKFAFDLCTHDLLKSLCDKNQIWNKNGGSLC